MTADQLTIDDAALTPEHLAHQMAERTFVPSGVYDIPNSVYHASPGLSSSGARKMIEPSCPALYRHYRDNPRPPKDAYDFGHAAHRLVLGAGEELAVFPKHNASTREGKVIRADWNAAREEGKTPITEEDHAIVTTMAAKLREHRLAVQLFANGEPEQSIFWRDRSTGVQLRARLDWLGDNVTRAARLIVPEYKTAMSVSPDDFMKAAAQHWYPMQATWNSDAVIAAGLAEAVAFVFVVQMKTPPYLVEIYEPDRNAQRIGRIRNRQAIDNYATAMETGAWKGFSDGVEFLPLPPWIERDYPEGTAA